MDTQAHCESCVYFDDHAQTGEQVVSDGGLCRFNPPVSQPAPDAHGLWPVVSNSDWCGHFAAPHAGSAQVAAQ